MVNPLNSGENVHLFPYKTMLIFSMIHRGFAGSPWFFQNSAWKKKKIKTLQSSDLGKDLFSLGEEKKKSSSFLGG